MICPVCGFENLQGEDICENCGADLSNARLAGTNFRRANLYETRLEGALFKETAMPDGTLREQ